MTTLDQLDGGRLRHLGALASEYLAWVKLTEGRTLGAEEQRAAQAQRSVAHDALIQVFDDLGLPYIDRADVRRQALGIIARSRSVAP